jgi:hypothetical protein
MRIKDMTTIDIDIVTPSACMGSHVRAPRYAGGDDVAAKILLKDLEGKLVKSNGVVLVKHGDVWTNDKNAVKDIMFRACEEANIHMINDSGKSRQYSSTRAGARNIVKTAKHYITVDENLNLTQKIHT